MDRNAAHYRKVLSMLTRRLQQREIQAATFGVSADPVINIEIEDLKKEIRLREWEQARYVEGRSISRTEYIDNINASISKIEDNDEVLQFDITGKWIIEEMYEFGKTTGDAVFSQNDRNVSGFITVHDITDYGDDIILQEDITGIVRAITVFLYGTYIHSIRGKVDDYELDQWVGIIRSNNLIEGNSEDIDGTEGKFVLKRQK